VGFGGAPGIVHRFAATPLICPKVVLDRVPDGERPVVGIVPILAPGFRSPPSPCSILRLCIVEHGYPVGVLQIIGGADFVLGIAANSRTATG
jgi:hypothetical protein